MKTAGIPLILALACCREQAEAPAWPPAEAAPVREEVEQACGQLYHDQAEAFRRSAGPGDHQDPSDDFPMIIVRHTSCTLADGYTARCDYEIAWTPTVEEVAPERLEWRRARGRFRFRGNRLHASRWYPVRPDACAAP